MTPVDVKYAPGTQKTPQQTNISAPAFTDTDHVHFPDGRLSTLPPYAEVTNSSLGSVSMKGAVRSVHAVQLTGAHVGTYQLYGAHHRLYARFNNVLYNITPLKSSGATLGSNPCATIYDTATLGVSTTQGSKLVVLVFSYGLLVAAGDTLIISGVSGAAVGGLSASTFNGTFTVLAADGTNITVQVSTAASSTANNLGSQYTGVTLIPKILYIHYVAHGLAEGDRVSISGVSGTIGGVPASDFNKEHIVSKLDGSDHFTVSAATTATSAASGGGASVVVKKQIDAGNIDQGTATGFGTGEYGEGLYGQGGPAVTAQSFPRIWSFADFGNEIVMCPGDYSSGEGQKIYIWDGDLTVAPTVLTNAPTDCNWVAVVNNSIVALCGRTVKISEQGNGTVWSGITYYSKTLERVWKLVSCFIHGEKEAVIFTPNQAILLRYVGGGDLWDLSDIYTDDGILSPQSAAQLGTALRWRGARGSYSYDGGPVKKDYNAQNEDWIIGNTNFGKAWKSFAYADTQNGQWYHHFPTGIDNEPNDYAIYNPAGHVTLGEMARTAAQRPGFVDSQFHLVNSSSASVAGTIYRHFTSGAVTFNWYATTSLAYAGDGGRRILVDQFIPDSTQSGAINLQVITRDYPQGSETVTAPYSVTASTKWLTVKASGRLVGMKLSGESAAALGAWKMNITPLGKR